MIIDCISDLHGFYPSLPGGDILIIAGDLTATHTKKEYSKFCEWYQSQNYRKKVLIAGNHDDCIQNGDYYFNHEWMGYLCDSGTEFEGLKVWGTPWTPWFHGVNPKCKAFMISERKLNRKFSLIPDDIDILITHGPPWGILDRNIKDNCCGSKSLTNTVLNSRFKKLKYHIFGHIHEMGGNRFNTRSPNIEFINCSYVDENYEPRNDPIRIEIK